MLEAIGVDTLDDLFADVSPKLKGDLNLPRALSEHGALSDVNRLANENVTGAPIFLGAGAYDRIVPSAVGAVISRGEFLTSYTPYQPEISQGVLQSIFEDRKSTRLNSSHANISYAVFCLKKKKLFTPIYFTQPLSTY